MFIFTVSEDEHASSDDNDCKIFSDQILWLRFNWSKIRELI